MRHVTFRDPHGRLLFLNGRYIRAVFSEFAQSFERFFQSPRTRQHMDAGRLVATRLLEQNEVGGQDRELVTLLEQLTGRKPALLLEHEPIFFPSYPCEWAPEMLHAAAVLTLDLAGDYLDDGLELKDATPHNVQFDGPNPVFVDFLSFAPRDMSQPVWLPMAQFNRTFILPLLAWRFFRLSPLELLLSRRDGLEPDDLNRLAGIFTRWRPLFFFNVTLPARLARSLSGDKGVSASMPSGWSAEKARFTLDRSLNGLRKKLKKLAPASGDTSRWTEYVTENNYDRENFSAKEAFVGSALEKIQPKRVLDVGANTGIFSRMAAKSGAKVVAVDNDPMVLGHIWRFAQSEKLSILPLNVNMASPTPGTGWNNLESRSFLDRAKGRFDMLLMLAVIHHMLVWEGVPLADILEMVWQLEADHIVIEYVGAKDEQFQSICRGRDEQYADYNSEFFEKACTNRFTILSSQAMTGMDRALYLLERKN